MKGYLFVQNNCPEADFWITENGSVSLKYHPKLIGCISLDKKNRVDVLINMILIADRTKTVWTAEHLNSIG